MFTIKHIWTALLLIALSYTSSQAANKGFGLGVIVGDPTGISGKLQLTDRQAITGAVAWSFRGKTTLHIHGDYLLYHDLSGNVKGELKQNLKTMRPYFHYGIGGRLRDEAEDKISIRFPLGITGQFNNAPVDLFFEIVPLLDLTPATEFDLNIAIGSRFYF